MKRQRTLLASVIALSLASAGFGTGCANMTPAQQRALSGGAIGAAGGALVGAAVGNPGAGAAIGGAAGAAGGYLYQKDQDSKSHYRYRHYEGQ
jgi:osmotically inducible lipoprotein OsmB